MINKIILVCFMILGMKLFYYEDLSKFIFYPLKENVKK